MGTRLSEQRKTTWARIVTALFPASATLIALHPTGLIVGLVIDTSYTAFTALAPSVILGFYWPRASTQGARWSIGIGLVTALITIGWWKKPLWPGCLQRFLDPDNLYGGAGFRLPAHAAPSPGGPGVL